MINKINKKNKGFIQTLTLNLVNFGSGKKYVKLVSGFTLVETLVAIAILSLSVLGTFTAVQGSLQNSILVKDQITAFYLAQEGMEFIKNMRDENNIRSLSGASNTWLTGITTTLGGASTYCDFGKTCTVDAYANTLATCPGGFGTCPVLRQDTTTGSTGGLFGYTAGWTATTFRREIQLTSINANEVLVTINMTWTTRGVSKSFQANQILYNLN